MGWISNLIDRATPDVAPQASISEASLSPSVLSAFFEAETRGALTVTGRTVLRNTAVYRCVSLISNTIGSLPFQLMRAGRDGAIEKASDHPLYDVLSTRPNSYQTGFVFRRLMQHRVLVHGNAYALVVRGGRGVRELRPIDPLQVTPKLRDDWTMVYEYRPKSGGTRFLNSEDVFHVMGPSEDGLKGLALVDYAAETLSLSLAAQRAAVRTFLNGVSAGGVLKTDKKLSAEALARLKDGMAQYQGIENAGKWIVGEEGLEPKPFGNSGKDNENVAQRQHQVEEVARIFGVPRPFLMVDDTSWGSGIEQLGIFFVQYGLAPHFVAWEQAVERTLLSAAERRDHYAKFNERALLRGSMKDQAEYFAKALGAGGSRPWMMQDEVRDLSDLAPFGAHAAELGTGMTAPTTPGRTS